LRSRLIFSVSPKFANRYLLCRMLSISARNMHRDGASTSQSINRSLQALHDAQGAGRKPGSQPDLETQALVEKEAALVAP
jgi:hypothetical protein